MADFVMGAIISRTATSLTVTSGWVPSTRLRQVLTLLAVLVLGTLWLLDHVTIQIGAVRIARTPAAVPSAASSPEFS